jgi:hypothetical protein
MKQICCLLFLKLTLATLNAQVSKIDKSYYNIVADCFGGLGVGAGGRLAGGFALSGQLKDKVLTFRYTTTSASKRQIDAFALIVPFPVLKQRNKADEYSLLIGKRFSDDNNTYCVSGGISTTQFRAIFYGDQSVVTTKTESYLGFSFDLEKRVYIRTYSSDSPLIRKVVSSFALRLFGNVSNRSYLALGVSFGLGYQNQ